MAEKDKIIVSVEIVDLDKQGYGPEGKHTRKEWRAECYANLKAGKEQFEAWQDKCISSVDLSLPPVEFVIKTENSQIQNNQDNGYEGFIEPHTLDFSGREIRASEFKNIEFKIYTKFDYAEFLFQAHFESSTFKKGASFNHVVFKEAANFAKVTFNEDVSFTKTLFNDWAWFRSSKFNKASFGGATFSDSVDFEKSAFESYANFVGAKFLKEFPNFRGSKVESVRLEFSDDKHFPSADSEEDAIKKEVAIKNISFLKLLADEHGQTDQALNFNAMELRAKRKLAFQSLKPSRHHDAIFLKTHLSWRVWIVISGVFKGQFWFWFFTLLYEKCSDFGRSYTRPLFLLMSLNLITFLLCVSIASQQGDEPEQILYASLNEAKPYGEKEKVRITAFRAASEYSIYKTGNFLDFSDTDKHTEIINQRLFGSVIEPSGMRLYGFIKGLLSAILIFLIGLGIRNKYRVS